jgi:hypothetical protein
LPYELHPSSRLASKLLAAGTVFAILMYLNRRNMVVFLAYSTNRLGVWICQPTPEIWPARHLRKTVSGWPLVNSRTHFLRPNYSWEIKVTEYVYWFTYIYGEVGYQDLLRQPKNILSAAVKGKPREYVLGQNYGTENCWTNNN